MIAIHGHRGCRGLLPENTIPAFQKAIAIGVDAIEMDLAISKDLQVVVSHEPYMSRRICLDPNGNEIPIQDDMKYNFFRMNYEEIKQFDCGLKYHPDYPDQIKIRTFKPLLSDVIEISKSLNPNIRFNLEIKSKSKYDNLFAPEPKVFVELVLEVINRFGVLKNTNLQSFDLRILKQIKEQSPSIRVALLIDSNEAIQKKLKKLSYKPEVISPYFDLLNNDMVQYLKKDGFTVIPWTVNSSSDLKRMISYNVDGIITDYPDRLKALLQ